jgi:hypothetical protein
MKALNSYELSNITNQDAATIAFMNVSKNLNENTWYKVTESIIGDQVTAQVKDSNGRIIENIATSSNCNSTVILVANNVDNAIIMKDLSIQSTDKPSEAKIVNEINNSSSINALPIVVLIAGILAAIIYFKRRVKIHNLPRA